MRLNVRADEIALVQTTMADSARAERLIGLLQERDRLMDESTAMLRRYRRELLALNADYDSSSESISERVAVFDRERMQMQDRLIELIVQMKATTTVEEWEVIAEFQLSNFKSRQQIYNRARGLI